MLVFFALLSHKVTNLLGKDSLDRSFRQRQLFPPRISPAYLVSLSCRASTFQEKYDSQAFREPSSTSSIHQFILFVISKTPLLRGTEWRQPTLHVQGLVRVNSSTASQVSPLNLSTTYWTTFPWCQSLISSLTKLNTWRLAL